LDPTLLGDENYLEPYPDLRAFLRKHPEILRDASSFLGAPQTAEELLKQQLAERFGSNADLGTLMTVRQPSESERAWRRFMDVAVPLFVFFSAITIVAWIVKAIGDHRRWLRISRIQSDTHSKLMDRFTNNEELLAYLQTPAGKRFFEALPQDAGSPRPSAPVSRILWSVQVGLLLLFGGAALQFVGWRAAEGPAEILHVLSVIGIALGISFMLGAAASYMISEKLGLLEQQSRQHRDYPEPPASS
jgi:hypothetical protein